MHSGMWAHAWDLRDEGLDEVLGFVRDLGVKAVNLASAYHAGYFIHPHNPRHKMFFAESGAVYFHPEPSFFADTPLQPQVAEVSATTDWFAAAGDGAQRHGLKLVAWTVCAHNTRLGRAHPDCAVRNVFGDVYHHALCLSNSAVRAYIRGVCRNLAARYPLHAVQLEALGFLGVRHQHSHARWGTVLRPLETWLMSLCFCHACEERASARGLRLGPVRTAVGEHLSDYFNHAPLPPPGRPATLKDMMDALPSLSLLDDIRHETETALIREIRDDLRTLGDTRLFVLHGHSAAWAPFVDAFSVSVYNKRPDEAFAIVQDQRRRMAAAQDLHAGVSLGFGSVLGPGELSDVVQSVLQAGATAVNFYNYSEAPRRALEWVRSALCNVE